MKKVRLFLLGVAMFLLGFIFKDAATPKLRWKVVEKTGFFTGLYFPSEPVVRNGLCFWSGGDYTEHACHVTALRAETGKEQWRFNTETNAKSPIIVTEKMVYASTEDTIFALSADTGKEVWRLKAAGAPVLMDDLILFPSSKKPPKLAAVNTATGNLAWQVDLPMPVYPHPPSVIPYSKLVYCVLERKHLYVFDAKTGEVAWKSERQGDILTPLVFSQEKQGLAYFVEEAEGGNRLIAFDMENQRVRWQFKGQVGGGTTPLINGGKVYWDTENDLFALNALTGETEFSIRLGYPGAWGFQKMLINGSVLYIPRLQNVYALDGMTGKKRWVFKMRGYPRGLALTEDQNTLIISDDSLVLYALDVSNDKLGKTGNGS